MEAELNKKLAEWAGFTKADIKKRYYYTVGGDRVPKWYAPNSEYSTKLPAFAQSLDDCFKWLVPRTYAQYGEKKTRELLEVWAWYVASGAYWGKEAKALCLAIEKLVEEVK